VFVDGDFWHGNAWRVRELDSLADLFPTNTDWWVAKIEGNVERDHRVTAELKQAGWQVLRVWESAILEDVAPIVKLIGRAIKRRTRVATKPRRGKRR
jgi:DNA mismatch endonuclease (patch repair protein)